MFKCKLVSCKFNGNDSKCTRKDFEKCLYFRYSSEYNCHKKCNGQCGKCDLHKIAVPCPTCWERYIKNNQDEDIEL